MTSQVVLRPLTLADEGVVDGLLARLTAYSMAVDGVPRTRHGAHKLLGATPPGMAMSSKHVFAIMSDEDTVGIVDLIDGFPRAGTAFIGLFAIAEDRHGQGLGRGGFGLLEKLARDQLGSTKLRLAVVTPNPVVGFWHRMGFTATGEISTYEGEARTGEAHVMEKVLRGAAKTPLSP